MVHKFLTIKLGAYKSSLQYFKPWFINQDFINKHGLTTRNCMNQSYHDTIALIFNYTPLLAKLAIIWLRKHNQRGSIAGDLRPAV